MKTMYVDWKGGFGIKPYARWIIYYHIDGLLFPLHNGVCLQCFQVNGLICVDVESRRFIDSDPFEKCEVCYR